MNKASIVIPVYGQWDLVVRNVSALLQYDRSNICEIILVDDCSPLIGPDFKLDKLVKVIRNSKNLGYAGTANVGLQAAQSEVVVLLDSDAAPTRPFVAALLSLFAADKTIGCIGLDTLNEDGVPVGNYQYEPSVLGFLLGQALESRLKIRRLRRNPAILPNSCAVSFRKKCLEELNFFDHREFPVLEADVDLSLRIHHSAWKLIYARNMGICHGGGHSYKVNSRRVQLYHASRWKLLRKRGQITKPLLAKQVLRLRVMIEIILLQVLSLFSKEKQTVVEKRKGRTVLLQQIERYE